MVFGGLRNRFNLLRVKPTFQSRHVADNLSGLKMMSIAPGGQSQVVASGGNSHHIHINLVIFRQFYRCPHHIKCMVSLMSFVESIVAGKHLFIYPN